MSVTSCFKPLAGAGVAHSAAEQQTLSPTALAPSPPPLYTSRSGSELTPLQAHVDHYFSKSLNDISRQLIKEAKTAYESGHPFHNRCKTVEAKVDDAGTLELYFWGEAFDGRERIVIPTVIMHRNGEIETLVTKLTRAGSEASVAQGVECEKSLPPLLRRYVASPEAISPQGVTQLYYPKGDVVTSFPLTGTIREKLDYIEHVAKQNIKIVAALYRYGREHRDLRLENLMTKDDGDLVAIDFTLTEKERGVRDGLYMMINLHRLLATLDPAEFKEGGLRRYYALVHLVNKFTTDFFKSALSVHCHVVGQTDGIDESQFPYFLASFIRDTSYTPPFISDALQEALRDPFPKPVGLLPLPTPTRGEILGCPVPAITYYTTLKL